MWELPLAVLNQLLVWDDLQLGIKPRWLTSANSVERDINQLFADALTAAG
jgi:hypothetical protein